MSKDGKDDTGPAFPVEAEAFTCGITGMTYRQWLAGQIGKRMMTDPDIIKLSLKRFNNDSDLTRKKLAQSTWMLTDYLIAEEHTGWPEED